MNEESQMSQLSQAEQDLANLFMNARASGAGGESFGALVGGLQSLIEPLLQQATRIADKTERLRKLTQENAALLARLERDGPARPGARMR